MGLFALVLLSILVLQKDPGQEAHYVSGNSLCLLLLLCCVRPVLPVSMRQSFDNVPNLGLKFSFGGCQNLKCGSSAYQALQLGVFKLPPLNKIERQPGGWGGRKLWMDRTNRDCSHAFRPASLPQKTALGVYEQEQLHVSCGFLRGRGASR